MIEGDFIFQYLRIKLTMLDGATSAEMFFRSAVANKCQLKGSECNNGSKEHFYLWLISVLDKIPLSSQKPSITVENRKIIHGKEGGE